MDRSVHLTFGITCLLAVLLLGLKMNAPVPCVEPGIVFAPEMSRIGESVIFKVTGTDSAAVQWDFGDGSASIKGTIVSHVYSKSGKFTVLVKTNQGCVAGRVVSVRDKEPELKPVFPVIKLSSTTVTVGEMIHVDDLTPGAKSWHWELGEGEQQSNERGVSVFYSTPGKKEINLSVRGDGIYGSATAIVTVKPKGEIPVKDKVILTPKSNICDGTYVYDKTICERLKAAANSSNRDAAFRPLVQMMCNQNSTHVKLNVSVFDCKTYNFYDFRSKLSNDEQSNWVVDSVRIRWKSNDGDRCIEDLYFMISSRK